MRSFLMLFAAIALITAVDGSNIVRHQMYSNATPSDEWIYEYFQNIIQETKNCLIKFVEEDKEGVNLSISLNNKMLLTSKEIKFYLVKGIKTNASNIINPFLHLSSSVKKLTESQFIFLKNLNNLRDSGENQTAYLNSREALVKMRISAEEINDSLSDIESFKIWNGEHEIHFNVSETKKVLREVEDLISFYDAILRKYDKNITTEGLFILVSDEHPILYQEVKIQIYAINVTPTFLYIDSMRYNITDNQLTYSFDKLGMHTLYAEGVKNGRAIRSNILNIYVRKIPTYIILSAESSAFVNENVEVVGYLSDYYGNPINSSVIVNVNNKTGRVETKNGLFNINVTKSTEGLLTIHSFYPGNEVYDQSNYSLSIFFSRFPVSIHLQTNKTEVIVNQSIKIKGKIEGARYQIPIATFLNSTKIAIFNSSTNFTLDVKFSNEGTYFVYSIFSGDSIHKPAISNKIEIHVRAKKWWIKDVKTVSKLVTMYPYYAILGASFVAFSLFLSYFYFRSAKNESKSTQTKVEKLELKKDSKKTDLSSSKIKIPDRVDEAYRILFNRLVSKYGLKKSLTPRELLHALKSEAFAEKLKTVTETHEKVVYGNIKINQKEKENYFNLISSILGGIE